MRYTAMFFVLMANLAWADSQTIGPDGIDSKATGLTGSGIEIGQVEPGGRSAKAGFDAPAVSASNTIPAKVYFGTSEDGANAH